MRIMTFFFIIFLASSFKTNGLKLEEIRKNFQTAVSDEKVCQSMIEKLSHDSKTNVELAYYGAFQTIWATHTMNPIKKLETFNKGKRNIAKAAALSPNNVEIIFIRYAIQKHSPQFLGYKDYLKEDENFLSQHLSEIVSPQLKIMVQKILNK